MTPDYKDMTPEQESALVPDWVEQAQSTVWWGDYPGGGNGEMIDFYTEAGFDAPTLGVFAVTPEKALDLIPVIRFLAATGRLPRLLDGGGV
ncbi:MAG: hypothetical protein JKY61_13030 [Planctomycetes bacterium]|nr:hypothetical protein [Planctomycetota bacterium]